jgi:hypothetical protein
VYYLAESKNGLSFSIFQINFGNYCFAFSLSDFKLVLFLKEGGGGGG